MTKNTFIFDMDGVIIDSEPLWQEAQIKVLANHHSSITANDCIRHTMGRRIDDVAKIWCKLHQLAVNPKVIEQGIVNEVVQLIHEKGKAKVGLNELLKFLTANKYQIALATSSNKVVIDAVFTRLGIASYFQIVSSAEDEVYGKPHPAIYINTLKKMNIAPENCIVLEDSVTGLIAAKAASLFTLVTPEDKTDPRFSLADGIFSSMLEVVAYLAVNVKIK